MKIIGLRFVETKRERVRTKSGKVFETGELINVYSAPDGTTGTYNFFVREASKGRLHGCLINF